MKVRVLTESGCGLTKQEAQALGIDFLPLQVQIEDKTYLDGVNLTVEELNSFLERGFMPQTSMPPLGDIEALLESYKIRDVYYRILQYMRDNNIYERYLKPILELSLYPPEIKTQGSENAGEGSGNSDGEEAIGDSNREEKTNYDSNTKTKTDTYDKISKKFIQDMFRSDNDL